jgi:hypothetical protein
VADVDAVGFGSSASGDGRDDFLWIGASLWTGQDRFLENVLAFARRRDLDVVFGQPPSNLPGVGDTVRPVLEMASEFGVDAWFNVGVFRDMTPGQFLDDPDRRERQLAGLREVADVFDDLFDGGRIVCWQEAPVMGRWADSGKWNEETVDNLLAHGPAVFEAQKAAIEEVNPALDVGLFVHFPYVVDGKRPEVFADLAAGLRERGAMPDFGFTDYYRGWYEKDVGPGRADAAVRSLVSNAREHLDGAAVYHLGQAHTIGPGHTPNRQTMRSNARVARQAGAAAVGWYMATTYNETIHGFDPFVPNAPDAEFEDDPVSTPTVARDRYRYAWDATLASRPDVDPDDRFDLWLHGDGLRFYDHRVSARTADGEWALLGDAGGYLDGDYPYAGDRTTVFGALERDRFLGDGALDLRIETDRDTDDGGGATAALVSVHAMPWDPVNFVAETDATDLLEGSGDDGGQGEVAGHELGRATPGTDLQPGGSARVRVPVERADVASLAPLVHPEHADAVRRLAAAEEREPIDPDARFDCWVSGSGLAGAGSAPPLVDGAGERVAPADASVVSVASADAVLFYGLERDRFLGGDFRVAAGASSDDGGGGSRVDAVFAMPYAGSAVFRSPERAATLLAEQPEEARRFAAAWTDLS